MNEDRVAAGAGFGTHAHDNMEIVSYVLEGALEHKDSLGNGEVLRPGEFQRISAGTGITHSEFNPSSDSPTHFYQIWLLPDEQDLSPSYEQKQFADEQLADNLRLVASPDGGEGSLTIHQDVRIYLSRLSPDSAVSYNLAENRHAWLQVLRGSVKLNELAMQTSDGAAVSDEPQLRITAQEQAEIILFDLN